jgi:hypothetical protein
MTFLHTFRLVVFGFKNAGLRRNFPTGIKQVGGCQRRIGEWFKTFNPDFLSLAHAASVNCGIGVPAVQIVLIGTF